MATRRSSNGTPKNKKPQPGKTALAWSKKKPRRQSAANIRVAKRERRRLLAYLENSGAYTTVKRDGKGRWVTIAEYRGARDETFAQGKDFLAAIRPKGLSYLEIKPYGETPYQTVLGDYEHTHYEFDARAMYYAEKIRGLEYDDVVSVKIVMFTRRGDSESKRLDEKKRRSKERAKRLIRL